MKTDKRLVQFGEYLKSIRQSKNVTTYFLNKETQVKLPTIAAIEGGKNFTIGKLNQYLDALGCELRVFDKSSNVIYTLGEPHTTTIKQKDMIRESRMLKIKGLQEELKKEKILLHKFN